MRRVEVFATRDEDEDEDEDVDRAIVLKQTFTERDGRGNWRRQSANLP